MKLLLVAVILTLVGVTACAPLVSKWMSDAIFEAGQGK